MLAILAAVVNSAPPTLAQAGAPATGNIALRDGANPGEVIISWDHVPQATHYRIGYVNMETDYPLAKGSVTGDWINAFIYVDENARNLTVSNGRAEYTVRRLEQGVRHAFTVLTSSNFVDTGGGGSVNSAFSWPSNPRWQFHTVADRGGACPTNCPGSQPTPPNGQPTLPAGATALVIPPTPTRDCYTGLQLAPGDSCAILVHHEREDEDLVDVAGVIGGGDYHGQAIIVGHGRDITIYGPWTGGYARTFSTDGVTEARIEVNRDHYAGDTWTITRYVNYRQ